METLKLASSRFKYIIILTLIIFLIILCHLYKIQIIQNNNFYTMGEKNFLRCEKIPSPRGNITDQFGQLIATNKPMHTVYWQGTGLKNLSNEQINDLLEIKDILDLEDNIEKNIALCEKQEKPYIIGKDVSFEQLSKIIEKFPNHKNILIKQSFKRYYPHDSIASHLVGYLTNIDMESAGAMGIELAFEESLKGKDGQIVKTINSLGKNLSQQELKKALSGDTIETTLNFDLQKIAEEAFPAAESGSCIILDPETGAIETLISRPTFNPNIFLDPITNVQWQEMQEKKCFVNRAFNACYPPASLFKLVTLAAALETGLITPDTSWLCQGSINFAGRITHCHKHEGHGLVNTQQALMHSCNIPFYEIGKKIKIDTLANYAQKFGLGSKTSDIFPEKAGLVPTSLWKKQTIGSRWFAGETLSATIGQSYYLVTPIQIACMISSICHGFAVKPKILTNQPVVKRDLDISKKTLNFLKQCLRQVIKGGTGRKLNMLSNIVIYGKTGTAQTSDLSKRNLGKKYAEHGYFAAYFKYKDYKPLTMVILLENVGSSQIATDLALKIIVKYCEDIDRKEKISCETI